jgi:quercetin dioxygenase-like cupin family protein
VFAKHTDRNYTEGLPGDSWNIPMNVTHGAKVLEDSMAIEVFSPLREDYLPKEARRT